jgi:hypothetical protein
MPRAAEQVAFALRRCMKNLLVTQCQNVSKAQKFAKDIREVSGYPLQSLRIYPHPWYMEGIFIDIDSLRKQPITPAYHILNAPSMRGATAPTTTLLVELWTIVNFRELETGSAAIYCDLLLRLFLPAEQSIA